MFLKTSDIEKAVGCILEVIETSRVLNNDLRGSMVVAVDQGRGYEVVYPAEFREPFPV